MHPTKIGTYEVENQRKVCYGWNSQHLLILPTITLQQRDKN